MKPTPSNPSDTWRALLERWQREELVEAVVEKPGRPARFAPLPDRLHPLLKAATERTGVESLYLHQRIAHDLASDKQDVVVVTGTNSGKTLCFHLPVLNDLLKEPMTRALVLLPTKALAQDQWAKLSALSEGLHIHPATLDGDTPMRQRGTIRNLSRVILSNPDFLHHTLLPKHDLWVPFLCSLRFIVLDEAHVYRGVFGSHVGNVLRRLLRLCRWHGSHPVVIAASATIGNPEELVQRLTGRIPQLVAEDGSPQGPRTFAFVSKSGSPNHTTARLLATLSASGVRTLAFCRSRNGAELVLRYAREMAPDIAGRLEAYRAGYTAKERRTIERGLVSGDLVGLATTNALELGIDIGGLDAVVMNGYPGTIAGLMQQAGRAGRGTRPGLAVFVAHDDPMEQFLLRDHKALLGARSESAVCRPENPQILGAHLRCAAYERPLARQELDEFQASAHGVAEGLIEQGELRAQGSLLFYPAHDPPASGVSIRGMGGGPYRLACQGQDFGTMEAWRAKQYAHEGAIYLHRGEPYRVVSVHHAAGKIELEGTDANYYTLPVVQTSIEPGALVGECDYPGGTLKLEGVTVTERVTGFQKRALRGGHTLDIADLSLPPASFATLAVRISLNLAPDLESPEFLGSVHGAEHALVSVAPLLAGCDRSDLASAWYALFPNPMLPTVFVYDKTPGGLGLCETLFARRDEWLTMALEMLTGCPCADGCPACLLVSQCPDSNRLLDKRGTVEALRLLTGW